MLELKNVTRRFGTKVAVQDVSLGIVPGSFVGVIGRSGAGKSTLLRMINRLVTPSAGRVLIDGRDTAAEPEHELRRRIGIVFQDFQLLTDRTVNENLEFVMKATGWTVAGVRTSVN